MYAFIASHLSAPKRHTHINLFWTVIPPVRRRLPVGWPLAKCSFSRGDGQECHVLSFYEPLEASNLRQL